MASKINQIEYYLPEAILSNEALSDEFPEWSVGKIVKKTGIRERRIVLKNETALDLAFKASIKLIEKTPSLKCDIDYIILCTQSPDYKLPTSACILQNNLGLKTNVGAIDINQGCSGFVYSLGLAQALINARQAKCVLVVTAETYSKYINKQDKSVRTLFGDGAAATIVELSKKESLSSFEYSTDGSGAKNLIVEDGGCRSPLTKKSYIDLEDTSGNKRNKSNLFMNGVEVFTFTLTAVKEVMDRVLSSASLSIDEIDHFVFHQPNKFMLDQIALNCGIPNSKLHRNYEFIGNTVSSTIPILLKDLSDKEKLKTGEKILICGFGVGYSAAGAIINW
jgi:3-oxoacyl-[acyl-carrier-protein] synthase III